MSNAPQSSASHRLELSARNSTELFDSTAPLCLGEHVVRREIENCLLEQLALAPRKAPVTLTIHMPPQELGSANEIVPVMRAFFAARSAEEGHNLSRVHRSGRIAAGIGMLFLILINGLAQGIRATFERRIPIEIANGLEIFGWVAMWRPAELLLYDWLPVRRKRNDLARLANMQVEFSPLP
jgi:hypothetical protein